MGILHVGAGVAKALGRSFASLDDLRHASLDQLTNTPEVGPVIAKSLFLWCNDGRNKELIARLRKAELNFQSALFRPTEAAGPLAGHTLVLTGTLANLTRDQASARIEAAGGKVSSSVSKKTSFVVVGASPGSKKEKAEALGIPVLTEGEFLERIGERGKGR